MSTDAFPVTIFHNPACGTSRNVVEMVRAAGYDPTIVEYLQVGWTKAQLVDLMGQAGVSPRAWLRDKGTPAAELGLLAADVSDDALLEAMVDRGADALEHLATAVDHVSRSVFKGNVRGSTYSRKANFTLRLALSKVGRLGDRSSKARDVLLGVGRMASFTLDVCHDMLSDEFRDQLHAVTKDVASLSDYEAHLSDKTQFLLDAVLGFITIEQNDIFKVLTIASVVGVPPTLMAGIWGMNFKFMPELGWTWGYPFAWAVIALSAILPLLWFWRRGWF